jgi:hypothetical protein
MPKVRESQEHAVQESGITCGCVCVCVAGCVRVCISGWVCEGRCVSMWCCLSKDYGWVPTPPLSIFGNLLDGGDEDGDDNEDQDTYPIYIYICICIYHILPTCYPGVPRSYSTP